MTIDWYNLTSPVSKYFTVGEVTQGDPRRIPDPGSPEEANILAIAEELDKVREAWNAPIGVTSWYRPPEVNAEVGGVWNSQHLYGLAVDVYDMAGEDDAFETFLDANWGGGLGYGVASGRGFTHLDLREGGFRHGSYAIRWTY